MPQSIAKAPSACMQRCHEEYRPQPAADLQGCSCDEQPPLAVEAQQRLPALALPVLDHVRLVQDEVAPLLALEHLRGRQECGERMRAHRCEMSSGGIRPCCQVRANLYAGVEGCTQPDIWARVRTVLMTVHHCPFVCSCIVLLHKAAWLGSAVFQEHVCSRNTCTPLRPAVPVCSW